MTNFLPKSWWKHLAISGEHKAVMLCASEEDRYHEGSASTTKNIQFLFQWSQPAGVAALLSLTAPNVKTNLATLAVVQILRLENSANLWHHF